MRVLVNHLGKVSEFNQVTLIKEYESNAELTLEKKFVIIEHIQTETISGSKLQAYTQFPAHEIADINIDFPEFDV